MRKFFTTISVAVHRALLLPYADGRGPYWTPDGLR